jgi:YtkA-like
MRQLIALSAVVAALAVVGTANAGGFATVGLSSLPAGVSAGEPWEPDITIRQHGVTPLDGLTPTLTIRNAATGASHDFIASATGEPGVYRAQVVFPESGRWTIAVATGWRGEGSLTAGPVTIEGAPGGGAEPGSFPTRPLLIGVVLVVLLAAATLGARRRWRPTALPR